MCPIPILQEYEHVNLSGKWLGVDLRINAKTTCRLRAGTSKNVEIHVQEYVG